MDLPDGAHIINVPGESRPIMHRVVFVIAGRGYITELCRHCFGRVAMVTTRYGKLQPRDADGQVHFATCPVLLARRQRRRARKPKQLRLP
jgi:hypothetical protein